MAINWTTMPVVETLTNAWQLIFVNPDSTQTFKGTVQDVLDLSGGGSTPLIFPSTQGIDVFGFNLVKQASEVATPTIQSATWKGSYVAFTSCVVGTNVYYYLPLGAGTFNFFVGGIRNNSSGVWGIYLEGTEIGVIDWYNSTAINNSSSNFSVTVPEDGWYGLSFVCTGKNAASTNFNLNLATFAFNRR